MALKYFFYISLQDNKGIDYNASIKRKINIKYKLNF